MKKLMIAVAAVAMAMGVNAATVDWSMNIAGKGDAYKGAGAYAMAFNGSAYTDVINLLTVTGSDNMTAALGEYALANGELGDLAVTIGNNRGAAKVNAIAAGGVTGNSMFWVIFEEGSDLGGKAITWTAATDVSNLKYEPPATAPGTFGLAGANFAYTGTIASVPEPTSGLLLLLGVAGMALRRRRA